jgi:hypothetical protein
MGLKLKDFENVLKSAGEYVSDTISSKADTQEAAGILAIAQAEQARANIDIQKANLALIAKQQEDKQKNKEMLLQAVMAFALLLIVIVGIIKLKQVL